MKRASFARAALAVMMLLATAVDVSAQGEANLQRRVSVNVNAVSPRQVLEMIARAVDCTLALDPKVATPVTIRVSRVTARTVLNAVCESVGCHWRLDGQTLRVGVEQPAATDAPSSQEGKPRLSDPLPSGEPVYVIGNGVRGPALVKQVNPSYTSAAMKAKVQGQVDVQFVVLRDGTVAEVKVTRKLSPELDEQAVAAVRQWVFTPGQLDGRPVAVRCEAQLAFNLRDREPSPDSDVALECEIAKAGKGDEHEGLVDRCPLHHPLDARRCAGLHAGRRAEGCPRHPVVSPSPAAPGLPSWTLTACLPPPPRASGWVRRSRRVGRRS